MHLGKLWEGRQPEQHVGKTRPIDKPPFKQWRKTLIVKDPPPTLERPVVKRPLLHSHEPNFKSHRKLIGKLLKNFRQRVPINDTHPIGFPQPCSHLLIFRAFPDLINIFALASAFVPFVPLFSKKTPIWYYLATNEARWSPLFRTNVVQEKKDRRYRDNTEEKPHYDSGKSIYVREWTNLLGQQVNTRYSSIYIEPATDIRRIKNRGNECQKTTDGFGTTDAIGVVLVKYQKSTGLPSVSH